MQIFVVLLICIFIEFGNSSKILIWSPLVGRSHAKFMAKIADLLVLKGHNVTFFQTIFDPDTPPEYDTLAQNNIIFHPKGFDPDLLYSYDYKNKQVFLRDDNLLSLSSIQRYSTITMTQCEGLISDPITTQLAKENFDLVIFEVIDLCPGLWLQYLGIEKLIAASSYGTSPIMDAVSGLNNLPSYVPFIFSKTSDHMTYFQRIPNFFGILCQRLYLLYSSKALATLSRRYPSKYHLIDPSKFLSQKISAYFINGNEFTETPRPVLRNFVFLGGLLVDNNDGGDRKLSKKYEAIYNTCQRGVVLISFGSLVKTKFIPDIVKKEFLKAFEGFPDLCFIWKLDDTHVLGNFTSLSDNVFIERWIPQQELLADNRTLLFITHAGANSINEAFAFGIPVITIPLYLDNFQNSAAAIRQEIGVSIDKLSLSKSTITSAIIEVTQNQKYKKNALKIATYLKVSRPKINQEMIDWVEKIINFGSLDHLRLVASEMSFAELYCLDIIVLFIFLIIVGSWILGKLIMAVYHFNTVSSSYLIVKVKFQ